MTEDTYRSRLPSEELVAVYDIGLSHGRMDGIGYLCARAHGAARESGWYERERNTGELIALVHSELSECLEALRHGNPADEHCPEYTSAEVELADAVIRIADMCGYLSYRLGGAIEAKMAYNKTRPRKHGKEF